MICWRTAIRVAALFAAAPVANAQQVQPGAVGFVLDNAISRVRPLWGVPGAARLGDALDLGADIAFSAASPAQDYLLVLSGPGSQAGIWLRSTQTLLPLAAIGPGAVSIAISPEGASAAFYFSATSLVRVVTGLPAAPAPAFDVPLSALMNPMSLFAVSDDGALLLASEALVAGNPAPSVVAFTASGVAGRIALSSQASALAFLSHSHDAVLSSASESVLIRDAAAQSARIALPSLANGATGVVLSRQGDRALAVNTRTGAVSILDLNPGLSPPVTLNCGCTATGIYRTSHQSVYRLNDYSGAPISLIDISSAQPRLLLIPPTVNPDIQ